MCITQGSDVNVGLGHSQKATDGLEYGEAVELEEVLGTP